MATGKPRPEKGDIEKSQSFEKAMERLEKIVAEMEDGTLSLGDMIARFEEGQSLIKVCSGKLNEVERKIEKLVNEDGKPVTEPLDPDEENSEDDNGSDSDENGSTLF